MHSRAVPREAKGEAWVDRPLLAHYKPPARWALAPLLEHAQVAQLVEHATENRSVGGSIPPLGTMTTILCDGMAGCRPDYMPVVLAALEAALGPLFTIHGLLCTTGFSSPIIVVNGPSPERSG